MQGFERTESVGVVVVLTCEYRATQYVGFCAVGSGFIDVVGV